MYHSIAEFAAAWNARRGATLTHLQALTDESLGRPVAEGHRTLGRIAWHIVQTIPEMMGKTGLRPEGPAEDAPVPASAKEIVAAYDRASASLLEQVETSWTDASLREEDEMYGQRWLRGFTLSALVTHEVHHCGQLTVLMRQAGLKVAGTFGPAKEEWTAYGLEPPEV